MSVLLQLYVRLFIVVYGLYTFFNRGVAYTYLAEITWLLGIVLVVRYRKQLYLARDKSMLILLVLLGLNLVYIARGFLEYPVMEVVRDSFMLNYAGFVVIIALLKPFHKQILSGFAVVYTWFPWVVGAIFLLRAWNPYWNEVALFGGIPLFVYKNGDLAVHLLISTILLLTGKLQLKPRMYVLQLIITAYLFLLTATFNRGGMLSFLVGISVYFFYIRKTDFAKSIFRYLRLAPILLLIAVPLYTATKIEDKTQGRNTGLKQLEQNFTSIVNRNIEGGLNDNVLWRLAWWGKIIDYTILGPYILHGKGLGVNLSVDDDIPMEDDSLRSPHNFHMNILARFGLPIALLWLLWIYLIFKPLFKEGLTTQRLFYASAILAFLVNATFDVALEGPMAAMPFWIFVGLYLDEGAHEKLQTTLS